MKNILPFPKRTGASDSNEDLLAALVILREVVGQLCERIEVLEARALIGAAIVPAKG